MAHSLEQANKADLAKVGAAKYQQTVGRPSKEKSLSPGDSDKSPAPKHDTRAEIAAKIGKSTGWVGMADVVDVAATRVFRMLAAMLDQH